MVKKRVKVSKKRAISLNSKPKIKKRKSSTHPIKKKLTKHKVKKLTKHKIKKLTSHKVKLVKARRIKSPLLSSLFNIKTVSVRPKLKIIVKKKKISKKKITRKKVKKKVKKVKKKVKKKITKKKVKKKKANKVKKPVKKILNTGETKIDLLYNFVEKEKKVRLKVIMKKFGIKIELAREWAKILETHGLITISYPTFGSEILKKKEIEKVEEE